MKKDKAKTEKKQPDKELKKDALNQEELESVAGGYLEKHVPGTPKTKVGTTD